ncbi:sit4 -associating protein-related [Anaeramoeba flamelloides]|nr:sit4 -associating protein-related [Anaeramoeba flamelloides]
MFCISLETEIFCYHLLEETDFLNRLLKEFTKFKESEENNSLIGYISHLFNIANKIVELSDEDEKVYNITSSSKEWSEFVEGYLKERNEIEEIEILDSEQFGGIDKIIADEILDNERDIDLIEEFEKSEKKEKK